MRDQYDEKADVYLRSIGRAPSVTDIALAALLRSTATEAEERGRQQAIEAAANAGAEHGIIDAIRAIGPSTTDTSAEQRGYERARREAVLSLHTVSGELRRGIYWLPINASIAAINAIGTTKEEG